MNWMQKDAQTSAQMEIAWQCAPVLTGVKPSNILTFKNVSEKEVAESLKEMGISYSMLCDGGVRKVWLIYREEEILEILRKEELKSGTITRDEYFEWKINWPQTCDGCGKYEPKKKWRI